ncbi:MAG: hypothetical protein HUU08_09715 [Candidatus Brocadia sp.]|nr:hypothetical protein [Candidatus Brocadia sp.]
MNEKGKRLNNFHPNLRIIMTSVILLLAITLPVFATTVVDKGTERKRAEINCDGHTGKVTVNDGVHFNEGEAEYINGVSIGYNGTKSNDCCWLQFVWDEILVYRSPEGVGPPAPVRKEGTIRTTGGSYELTTDPKSPNYNVDSASDTNPCYDSRGSRIKTDDSITMYDRPDSIIKLAEKEQKDPKVTRIESKAHFEAYLVCNKKICCKVSWVQTYTWTPKNGGKETGPEYQIEDPNTSADLNQGQKDRLKKEYPDQTVLPQ